MFWLTFQSWLRPFLHFVDLSILAVGTAHSTKVFWDWIKPFWNSWVSNLAFLMFFPLHILPLCLSLKCRYHFSTALCITQSPGHCYSSESCARACVCVHVFFLTCVLVPVPSISVLVCRVLVCQSCVCAYVCLCSSAAQFHSIIQKVTRTR